MEHTNNLNKGSLKKLIKYIMPYKLKLVGVIISLMITSSAVLLIGKSMQYFIDNGLAKGNVEIYDQSLIVLIGIVILLASFTFLRFYLITQVGELIVADMRNELFKHIVNLSPKFYETRSAGEIVSRMNSDMTILQNVMGSSVSSAARNIVTLIGGIFMLSAISMKLTFIIFGFIPIVLAPIIYFGRRVRNFSKITQDKVAQLSSICEQSVNYIRSIQAFNRENYEAEKFSAKVQEQLSSALDRIALRSILTAIVITLSFGGIVFVLWIGGHQVLKGAITAGELSAFVFISVICAGAAGAISEVYGDYQKTVGASTRIFEFLEIESDVKDNPASIEMTFDNPNLVFENASYYYENNPNKLILDNISINFIPGKINALVGKSGAGKSTIISLLQRFFDLKSGSITINGIDIRDIKLTSLRSMFTYVAQDPVIFSTTIYENIRYGKLEATLEEIMHAAQEAECLDFIELMPNGIYSEVGDKGIRLSGGQKQRIAIARAILSDPQILLLDEATSSLDSENELKIHKAIQKLVKDRTCIIIAHRLSTIKNADQIIVLDNAKIEEIGTHEQLVLRKGLYYNLAQLQFELDTLNHKELSDENA